MPDDNTVAHYGWDSAGPPNSCSYIVPEIIHLLERISPERVLDLGSGNGSLCAQMKACLGIQVAGVEYDRKGVEIASSAYPDIAFHRYGVQDDPALLLEREGEPFDVVVSTEVIEHLFSPQLLPQYAHAVLKPEGQLILTTPYHGYLKNLLLSLADKWDNHHTPLWEGGHIKFWSRKTLTRLLDENGFEVTGFAGVGRLPYLWKSMVLIARKKV